VGIEMRRREFLKLSTALGVGIAFSSGGCALELIDPSNPLSSYPNRDWESLYRDQYSYDRSFTWVCAPNDTHMCRLRAFVRNGVVVRSEQNYDHQDYTDIYGNAATNAWNPRGCLKGFTMQRRLYGPFRLKGPVVRKGWKQWADDGFPSLSDSPELRSKYMFDNRGNDDFARMSWDEVSMYAAKGLKAVAETYSGDEGRRRLEKDGYPKEMFHHWHGAGTRTMKIGSSLPLHGIIGKFGLFKHANIMALLDANVRGVSEDDAKGAREWTEYTWRGDQAPGQPFVHGLQTSDCDMNDMRHSKLIIQVGKNLVENKMPESHWGNETMERGGKLVSIAPDYNAPAAKADYWISVRPGLSDTALFLGLNKILMERGWYDADFVKRFTDLPLLVRTDNLKRLSAADLFDGYQLKDISEGPSFKIQGMTSEQREKIGDYVYYDNETGEFRAMSRDEVGTHVVGDPALEGTFNTTLVDGTTVEVMPAFEMYLRHLKDYDPETVSEICGASVDNIERLAKDLATIKPAAIHYGEGINHYFHATLHNRATAMTMLLTGNIGKHGAGVFTWAGNYKGAMFQGSSWTGPGAGSYFLEDPFHPNLDENARITSDNIRNTMKGEEVSYWGYGDRPLIVETPKEGRRCFTGDTHLPTPTKLMWYNNANLINQAKWVYDIIVRTFPKIDMIVDQQVEWTGSAEYSDIVLPANTWLEQQDIECGGSCSNPFIQVWGGNGVPPVHDSKDDAVIFADVSRALAKLTGDERFNDNWHFINNRRADVYLQRVFDNCTTTRGTDGPYKVDMMMNGEYGNEPGAVMMLTRTYPRVPFFEQVEDNIPFYTATGRMDTYCDIPEAIEYGENLITHREAVEATPHLPNVIVSTSPYIRPVDYGIPLDTIDAELRTVRNVKMPWARVKESVNPLWAQGFRFFCSTPKSRHTTHSSWSSVDWNILMSSSFTDPHRKEKRQANEGDREIQMNPQAAKDLGLNNGDYVYVDSNPTDRPFKGWENDDKRYKAFRCMVRLKYNGALPYHFSIMKHTGWIATERTVQGHETREDGLAMAKGTGYVSSYRYGSHQSITRNWLMPMHQTDSLFHKKVGGMAFTFGFDVDNHAVNTVPKETLVRIVKAEDGGLDAQGIWTPATTGHSPGNESDFQNDYLVGNAIRVRR
jgi:nitrate reductase / nitrite oxidoreductase, alpha subunit